MSREDKTKKKELKEDKAKKEFIELIKEEYPRELKEDSFTLIISRLSYVPRGRYIEASRVEGAIRDKESLRNVSICCILEMLGFTEEDTEYADGSDHFFSTARWKRKTFFTVEAEEISPADDEIEEDTELTQDEITKMIKGLQAEVKAIKRTLQSWVEED